MKLSLYTCIRDGLRLDFHAIAMLKHHLPLADEIIVHEGYSSDGTYEAIKDLDPKIQVFRSQWPMDPDVNWYIGFKIPAVARCTGDWIVMLDCDEFIPEWEFAPLRAFLAETDAQMVRTNFLNFYGNYKVYHNDPQSLGWPPHKACIHRNRPEIELWGDGSNVRIKGQHAEVGLAERRFTVHHFGFVRHAARLREKWKKQAKLQFGAPRDDRTPSFLFDLFPHKWNDTQFAGGLVRYEGPYIQAVRDDPQEFVRDDFEMYRFLGGK